MGIRTSMTLSFYHTSCNLIRVSLLSGSKRWVLGINLLCKLLHSPLPYRLNCYSRSARLLLKDTIRESIKFNQCSSRTAAPGFQEIESMLNAPKTFQNHISIHIPILKKYYCILRRPLGLFLVPEATCTTKWQQHNPMIRLVQNSSAGVLID